MNFNKHYHLEGLHAFLGASKYHWVNYDDEKLVATFNKHQAAQKGTALHELAHQCIQLRVKLPKTNKTLNMYVNDAIGFKMQTEQPLYFSENCFGTVDAISFNSNLLRIHDLKTGDSATSMKQLIIYMALFCLEYHFSPFDITAELRIYQTDDVVIHIPDPEEVFAIMDTIVRFDKIIDKLKLGG